MPIGLAFRQNIQIVKISGALNASEASAIRLKLDQKLSQNRQLFAFDLEGFTFDEQGSLSNLISLLGFLQAREARCALYGVKAHLWKGVPLPSGLEIHRFEVESEAAQFLNQPAGKSKAAGAGEKSQENTEDDIKKKNLEALITKYETFQVVNDYDPLMLAKLKEEYRVQKGRKALSSLRQALNQIDEKQKKNQELEAEVSKEAIKLEQYMTQRKIPLSPQELDNKRKSVQRLQAEVEKEINELTTSRDRASEEEAEWRKKAQEHDVQWKAKMLEVQQQIDTATRENQRILADLERRDKEEEEKLKLTPG